jgi:hypothetical protein
VLHERFSCAAVSEFGAKYTASFDFLANAARFERPDGAAIHCSGDSCVQSSRCGQCSAPETTGSNVLQRSPLHKGVLLLPSVTVDAQHLRVFGGTWKKNGREARVFVTLEGYLARVAFDKAGGDVIAFSDCRPLETPLKPLACQRIC